MSERASEQVTMRITPSELKRLDEMRAEGKWRNRAEMVRSMIRAILDDDAAAHGLAPLPKL